MKILILCSRDTTIRHFIDNHVVPLLELEGHRLQRSLTDCESVDLVIFSDFDANIHELRARFPSSRFGLIDPKLNNKAQRQNLAFSNFGIVSSLEQFERALPINRRLFINHWYRFALSTEKFDLSQQRRLSGDKIRIAYHGNRVHLDASSDTLVKGLNILGKQFDFTFVAIYNIEMLGLWSTDKLSFEVEHIQWDPNSYLERLQECDIGVIPNFLPSPNICFSTIFSKFKRYFLNRPTLNLTFQDYSIRYKHNSNPGRLFDFARVGLPVVAESTLSMAQEISHGRNGFLVQTKEGWSYYLEKLLLDPELRLGMGSRLQEDFLAKKQGEEAASAFIDSLKLFM